MTDNDVRAMEGLPRVCECGCGTPMQNARKGARYATDACRTRAYRSRNQTAREPSQSRHRTRRPDMRITYTKALAALADDYRRLAPSSLDPETALQRAAKTLAPLLTDRQRKHLEAKPA